MVGRIWGTSQPEHILKMPYFHRPGNTDHTLVQLTLEPYWESLSFLPPLPFLLQSMSSNSLCCEQLMLGEKPLLIGTAAFHMWISSETNGIDFLSLSGLNEAAAANRINGVEVLQAWGLLSWTTRKMICLDINCPFFSYGFVLGVVIISDTCFLQSCRLLVIQHFRLRVTYLIEKLTVTSEEKDYLLIRLRWWWGSVKPAVCLGMAFSGGSAGWLASISLMALLSLGFSTDIAVGTETRLLNC